jgi:hypothetical protein
MLLDGGGAVLLLLVVVIDCLFFCNMIMQITLVLL